MANTYYDATGVLTFNGPAVITPVIRLLFNPYNLDDESRGDGDTERTIAQCSEEFSYLWDGYLEGLAEDANKLIGIAIPEGSDSVLILKTIGLHFGVDLTGFIEDIDFDGMVGIDSLVTLARLLPDGHNLAGFSLQGAWHCDRPRLWEFGGWCTHQSEQYAIDRSISADLDFARAFGTALVSDRMAASELLYRHIAPYFDGIVCQQVRADLRRRVGERLCARPMEQSMDAASSSPVGASWTRSVYVEAHSCDEHGEGPVYAHLEVTPRFIATLLSLQALCVAHQLLEVSVSDGPDAWGPSGIDDELRLNNPELVVTPSLFWFRDQPKHCTYTVETSGQRIDSFVAEISSAGAPVYLGIEKGDIEALDADLRVLGGT